MIAHRKRWAFLRPEHSAFSLNRRVTRHHHSHAPHACAEHPCNRAHTNAPANTQRPRQKTPAASPERQQQRHY